MDEYYYSGSEFYADDDGRINSDFTDVGEQRCLLADCVSVSARRYGQWWTLTGVAPGCPHRAEAQQKLRWCYSQIVTLNHPNITRAVAMIQTPLMPDECVVEEYVDGQTLGEFISTEPDEESRLKLLEQIVDALLYCHRKGVVHGNLSLQSVVVTHQGGVAKLVAFGCEGEPQDDIRALADIVEALQLPVFKPLVERCRNGQVSSMDEVAKAVWHPKSRKWRLLPLVLLALLAAVLAGAFWAGHRMSLIRDSEQADSFPLPSIYFSDTSRLAIKNDNDKMYQYRSMLTGVVMYYLTDKSDAPGPIDEDVAVDLGLSVLWAPFNLGSGDANVGNMGEFFMWCDTLGIGPNAPVDKYWPQSRPMVDIAGGQHDAVRRIWGGRWRMPTHAEWKELADKCKWILMLERGIPPGYKVHGPGGAEIFLPLAGYGLRYRSHDIGLVGHYWSSTPVAGAERQAHAVRLDTAIVDADDAVSLEYCLSIRPVIDKK